MTDIHEEEPKTEDGSGPDAPPPVSGGRLTSAAQRIESRGVGIRDGDAPPLRPGDKLPGVVAVVAALGVVTLLWPGLRWATLYLAVAVAVIGLTDDRSPAWRGARLGVLLTGAVALGVWRPWVLVVILAVVFMIFMHELGHYVMARRADMKVTEFFIFFGPKIWSFTRGETEYGLKCIPAGAYVKIVGMTNLEEVDPADEARAYRQKTFGQRVGVAVAGSTMHFLMALVLIFAALVLVGQPGGTMDPVAQERDWRIGNIVEGSGADRAGLRVGDRLVAIDGEAVGGFDDVRAITSDRVGETVPLVYERDGARRTVPITLQPKIDWYVARVPAGSPPDRAGLRPGDQVLAVDGRDVTAVRDLDAVLDPLEGRTVPLRVARTAEGGETTERTVRVEVRNLILTGNQVLVGIGAEGGPDRKLGVVDGLAETPKGFVAITRLSLEGLGRFFTPGGIADFAGQVRDAREDRERANPTSTETSATLGGGSTVSENRLLSIFGLVRLGGDAGEANPSSLVFLFALINIFIGVFNLVPLLPFDGGHVMIAVYEKIQEVRLRRKRYFTDAARLLPLTYVVVVAMALLFFSTIYLDIANPIST